MVRITTTATKHQQLVNSRSSLNAVACCRPPSAAFAAVDLKFVRNVADKLSTLKWFLTGACIRLHQRCKTHNFHMKNALDVPPCRQIITSSAEMVVDQIAGRFFFFYCFQCCTKRMQWHVHSYCHSMHTCVCVCAHYFG